MQFSIRWLLLFVAAAAAASMLFFAVPDAMAFWSLLITTMAVPSLAIPVIVYGREDVRAFAIGVVSSFGLTPIAFWFLPMALSFTGLSGLLQGGIATNPEDIRSWKLFVSAILGSALFTGLSSVAIRHACLRERRQDSDLPNLET